MNHVGDNHHIIACGIVIFLWDGHLARPVIKEKILPVQLAKVKGSPRLAQTSKPTAE